MRGGAEENKSSAKVVYIGGEEKKKRRRFQQWSGFKLFLFYSRFNNCVGDIGWEIWRMNR